ncbi:MAG: tetratricopeptide repeat protein [Bryobacterales bacterium]|nr:tetratricopeptide repeat protein [Bryobacterales bacterium]
MPRVWGILLTAGLAACAAQTQPGAVQERVRPCHELQHRGKRTEARACYQKLTQDRDPALRAEGFYGLRDYRSAHEQFRLAADLHPKDPNIRVRWGRLLIEPFNRNRKDGAELFQEALEIDKNHAGAHLGLALLASEGFESKAVELAQKALEADPKLVEAQELLATLALEDSDPAKAVEEADKALKISSEALDALATRAAVELLADRPAAEEWLKRMYAVNPYYGAGHSLIAHHLVINRRYEEGIAHYRKAVELDPEDWATRSELGINLMRVGLDQEAREQLKMAFDNGCRNSATVNSLTLLDSYKNFVTFKTDNTIVKLHKKEAELLRLYFEEELRKAIKVYEGKYKIKLPREVQLEVYPDHEDFAVRTMGMPGLGALGVTFGDVVAMDSPSGRKPGTFHWASTLWHELSHVFVLIATKHRVPRWFTEGVAVHEETAIYPDWGDRLSPEILMAIKEKKLLPIAELDRGFVRPSYPNQVIVSYFQAGRICDFIKERWGWDSILAMMHAFAARKSTPEVVEQVLKLKPDAFDKEFMAWLDKSVNPVVSNFDAWRKSIKALAELAKAGKQDEVIRDGQTVIKLYPDYVEAANAYEFIAEAHTAKGQKKEAIAVLGQYLKNGGRSPDTLKKLAKLQEEVGDKKAAAVTLEKVNYIYPVNDEELHRRLGELWLTQQNYTGAIREFSAVLAGGAVDQASAHFNIARAYLAAKQSGKAEDHLLQALESAPGFRPAQKLLLEIENQKEKR